jgi:hypothetical protein
VAYTRVAKTAAATLTHVFTVDETPTDSTTTVTVTIVDANGTSVASGNATSAGAGTGGYTYTLPGQSHTNILTVSWTATINGATVVEQDTVEIVGGFFFSLVEGRASDSSLNDTGKYPTARLALARLETEVECEEICDRAFTPRYARVVLDGSGTDELMLTGHSDLRSIRSVKVAPRVGETFVAYTSAELAALTITPDRVLQRTDRNVFTEGRGNVVVEYEYGLDHPPSDLRRAAFVRFKNFATVERSSIPDRALSWTSSDGTTYRMSIPDAYRTGIPYVDGIYGRYSLRANAGTEDGKAGPASRQLSYDPQHHTLFHGGRR